MGDGVRGGVEETRRTRQVWRARGGLAQPTGEVPGHVTAITSIGSACREQTEMLLQANAEVEQTAALDLEHRRMATAGLAAHMDRMEPLTRGACLPGCKRWVLLAARDEGAGTLAGSTFVAGPHFMDGACLSIILALDK